MKYVASFLVFSVTISVCSLFIYWFVGYVPAHISFDLAWKILRIAGVVLF